tara:strand:+ start:95 stop:409 length:315 start_codon:yes stop_codon:yes gene_type:complete
MYPSGGANGYQYELRLGNCTSTGTSITKFAKEWITKYVTQLYNTIDCNPGDEWDPTGTTSDQEYKFRRAGVNQEGTVNGYYVAEFDQNTGARVSASSGCLSNTL